MKHETFFDNFEVLADAPNGVQKLRELILQLAIQGKLVPQDEKDEPASVLMEKIKAERKLLINEKTIKKLNSLPPIEVKDIPYDLPGGWKWVRLGDLGQTQTGTTPSKSNPDFFGKDYPFLKPGDISDNFVEYCNEGLSSNGIENGRLIKAGSILMVCIGGSIGKVNWVDRDCSCNQQINVLTPFLNIDSRFLTYFMRSRYFQDKVILTAPQTTLPILSKGKWELIPFPLPPLNEVHRIVTKVDQLMSLCDELEARQQKKRESRAHINSAALDRLLAARAPGDFAEGWRRVSDNFDLLYDSSENVGALRQAILQLAVMGKLLTQDSNDELASVLLGKIKAEKERMIKEKKIRKSDISPVEPNELPNTLPGSWVLSNINEISLLVTDGEHQTPPRINTSEVPLGTAKNVRDGHLDLKNTDYVSLETALKCWKRCEPMHDDILMVCVGATTGRLCLSWISVHLVTMNQN